MRRLLLVPLALGLIGLLGAAQPPTPNAAGGKATQAKAGPGHQDPFSFPKEIELSDKQTEELALLKKEYQPKLQALHARFEAFMTPERRKVMEATVRKGMAEGKKGKELHDEVMKAMNLSPQDQARAEQLHADHEKLMKEIEQRKMALLTSDQREKLQAHAKLKAEQKGAKEKPKAVRD
jgi:hypothetical protein